MIFIIAASYNNINQSGFFLWQGKYLMQIKNFLPDKIVDNLSIHNAIVYNSKKIYAKKNSYLVKITKIELTANYLKLLFNFDKTINYTAYQIKSALKSYLNKSSVLELPFCAAVDESKFFQLLDNNDLLSQIILYEKNHDWNKIHQLFNSLGNIEEHQIWNNPIILNKFSFAAAKLSECSENLKKKFSTTQQINEFLIEKKQFRELTIKLRKRCVELQNNNPAFYSNLAYTYYQSAIELSTYGRRKDGNLISECSIAVNYIDKALEIDKTRIKDLYRKSFLLSEILVNHSLYINTKTKKNTDNLLASYDYISSAIESLEQLINIYQSEILEPKLLSANRKYYIKSLFKLAALYLNLAKIGLNPLNILINESPLYNINYENANKKLEYLNKAINYLQKCIIEDAISSNRKNIEQLSLLEQTEINNFIAGIYKAYLYGKIILYKYLITKNPEDAKLSKNYLLHANEIEFPREQRNQRKIFVLDKIAVIFLIESKYPKAINILQNIISLNRSTFNKNILPDYAAYTLTIAYLLNNQTEEAQGIIKNYSACKNKLIAEKFNKLQQALIPSSSFGKFKLIYKLEAA